MGDASVELGLVERAYAAAYDPDGWRDYALALRDAAGATSVSLLTLAERPILATELTVTAKERSAYEAHFWRVDNWRNAAPVMTPGTVWMSHESIADTDFADSEFYRDYLRPNSADLFYFAGGPVYRRGATDVVSGILRARDRGPFGDAERRLMAALSTHVDHAIRIDQRMRRLRAERDAAGMVANRAPLGLVMLGRGGRILAMNPAAEAILLSGDGLSLAGGLGAMRPIDDVRLRELIRRAAATPGRGGSMALPRPSGRRPYWIVCSPAPGKTAAPDLLGERDAVAVLFISDPDRVPRLPAHARPQLQEQYGLTPMEAQVAIRLAEGRSASEIAEALGCAVGTVEIHVKRVRRKFQVHSRAELVAALLASVGTIGILD